MKGFIKKLMLASSLLILTVVLLTYVFILYFEAMEENRYRIDKRAVFSSSFSQFEQGLQRARERLDYLTQSPELPVGGEEDGIQSYILDISKDNLLNLVAGEGFTGLGHVTIPSDHTLAPVYFTDNGVDKQLEIISDIYRGFGEYVMFSCSSAKEAGEFFFFGKRTNKALTGYDYILLLVEESPLKDRLSGHSFTNFALLNKQRVVVQLLSPNSKIASMDKNDYDGEYVKFENETYLCYAKVLENYFLDYSIVGLVSRSSILRQISDISVRFYIFMVICCLLMFGFFAAFLVLIRVDKVLTGAGEYRLDVDSAGNIIRSDKLMNKNYKRFIGNISKYVEHDFSRECIVIKGETITGERAYFNCKKLNKKRSTDYIFMASDVTDLYNDYLAFRKEHFTDDVTSMNNIQQLEMDFDAEINERSRKPLCFIIYDLGIDKFLAMYGIEFYKKLLKTLSERLAEIYVWQAKIYYLTSDRFVVLANKDVQEVVAKIDSAIEFVIAPVRIDELMVRTVCKAGYLIYLPKDEPLTLPQIISRAELALSYAKGSNKKNHYGYVDSVMRSKQTLSNEDIKQIILADEIRVCFQPQYSIEKERIVGFEALTRLSGRYSYINPGVFIENVEQIGAMVMLGDYIMEKSMKFAASLEDKSVKISVNVSPVQLLGEKFVERFLLRMQEYKLENTQIGIEITETYEMSSMAKAREKLREIQKQGISVGIDDFGEKYSSLRYIKSLPIDFIKIDKGFIDEVENDRYSRAIVEMIVGLAKKLNLYTTVEGVETLSQVRILEKLGADLIQGYIVSPAVEEDVAREYIITKRCLFSKEEE